MRFIFKTRYDQDIRIAKHGGYQFWYGALMLVLLAAPWVFPEYWLAQVTFVLIYGIVGLGHHAQRRLEDVLRFIEVHLSNPHSREDFRKQSYLSDLAKAVICGFGPNSYHFALEQLLQWFAAAPDATPPQA